MESLSTKTVLVDLYVKKSVLYKSSMFNLFQVGPQKYNNLFLMFYYVYMYLTRW